MSNITNKQLFELFFRTLENGKHRCLMCPETAKPYSQNTSKGYNNLVTHLDNKHPHYMDGKKFCLFVTAAREAIANDGQLNLTSMVNKSASKAFDWIELVVMKNLPLDFCNDALVR